MTIYVAEINGRGIAAFNAPSEIEAEERIEEEVSFKSDLMKLENCDEPLWDGRAEIYLREAFPEEADRWRASYVSAKANGEVEGDDDDWFVFLLSVTDPTDE